VDGFMQVRSAPRGAVSCTPWSTALAVLGVAAVAAVASHEHAYDVVRAHGEAGWTARLVLPLTVDGLIYASSGDAGFCAPQSAGSCAGAVAARLGYRGEARGQRRARPGS
jgi:hypothetical protein